MCLFCSICTGSFKENSSVVSTVCGHIYHEFCLDEWLNEGESPNCPECRDPVSRRTLISLYLNYTEGCRETHRLNERLENELQSSKELINELKTEIATLKQQGGGTNATRGSNDQTPDALGQLARPRTRESRFVTMRPPAPSRYPSPGIVDTYAYSFQQQRQQSSNMSVWPSDNYLHNSNTMYYPIIGVYSNPYPSNYMASYSTYPSQPASSINPFLLH